MTIYSNIISKNQKYLTLLSEKFTPNRDIRSFREYTTVSVEDMTGGVYHLETWPLSKKRSTNWVIQFQSSVLRPWVVYLTLSWEYPNRGVFQMKFRMDDPKVKRRNNRVTMAISTDSPGYSRKLANARSRLREMVSQSSRYRNVASSVRPNQTVTKTYPTRYQQTPIDAPWKDTTGTATATVYTRNWTGTRTPGYWRKKASQLPVNNHTVSIVETDVGTLIEYKRWNNGANTETSINIHPQHYNMPAVPTNFNSGQLANDKAWSNLLKKMDVDVVNIAQDLGEIGQTTSMIAKTARRITGAHHALKQGNLSGAVQALWTGSASTSPQARSVLQKLTYSSKKKSTPWLRALAENWLELQYGWKPLLADVHDVLEKSSTYFASTSNPVVGRVSASGTTRTVTETPLYTWTYPAQLGGATHVVLSNTERYVIRFKMADRLRAFLAQTGFTNPINLAWELLPYSFVVDWFATVGPWLESFTQFEGLEFLDGSYTRFQRQSTSQYVAFAGKPAGATGDMFFETVSSCRRNAIMLDRSKLTTWPKKHLPHLKNPWSVDHALNALALLNVSFGFGSRLRR